MNNHRPSWNDYFRDIVLCTASRSSCHRLKVGCLLVKDNRIVSQGYNGALSGHPHTSVIVDNHEMATIHAEQNAIIDCAKRGVSCNHSVAYITHFPCIHCLKMLIQAGVKHIYYIHDYKNCTEMIKELNINISISQLKTPDEKTSNQ